MDPLFFKKCKVYYEVLLLSPASSFTNVGTTTRSGATATTTTVASILLEATFKRAVILLLTSVLMSSTTMTTLLSKHHMITDIDLVLVQRLLAGFWCREVQKCAISVMHHVHSLHCPKVRKGLAQVLFQYVRADVLYKDLSSFFGC